MVLSKPWHLNKAFDKSTGMLPYYFLGKDEIYESRSKKSVKKIRG